MSVSRDSLYNISQRVLLVNTFFKKFFNYFFECIFSLKYLRFFASLRMTQLRFFLGITVGFAQSDTTKTLYYIEVIFPNMLVNIFTLLKVERIELSAISLFMESASGAPDKTSAIA